MVSEYLLSGLMILFLNPSFQYFERSIKFVIQIMY